MLRELRRRRQLRRWRGQAVVAVFGEAVLRLPRLQLERNLEWVRQIGGKQLPAQPTFVGDESNPRPIGKCRPEIAELMVLGDDLGQRSDREPAALLVEHLRGPFGGCPQRQAVLGECRRRPQLPTGGDCGAAAVAQFEQCRPVGVRAELVDEANQTVEVGSMDEVVDFTHTIGHG